jgi:hypothetical protein
VGNALAAVLIALCTAWGALALYYQAGGGTAGKAASLAAWVLFGIGAELGILGGRLPTAAGMFALGYVVLLLWWRSLKPSNDRSWADDVAEMVQGTVQGSRVTLTRVRNFVWRTPTDYTPAWVTRTYDLDQLR